MNISRHNNLHKMVKTIIMIVLYIQFHYDVPFLELCTGPFKLTEQLLLPTTSSVGPSYILTTGQKLTHAQLQMILDQLPPHLLSMGHQLHITVQHQEEEPHSVQQSSSHHQTQSTSASIEQFPCDLQGTEQGELFKCHSGFELDDYAMDIDDVPDSQFECSDRVTLSTSTTADAASLGGNTSNTELPITGTKLEPTLGGDLTVLLESVNAAIELEYGNRRRNEATLDEVIAAINAVESRETHPVFIQIGSTSHRGPEKNLQQMAATMSTSSTSGGVMFGGVSHGPIFSDVEQRLLLRELRQESRCLNMDLYSYINAAIKNVF